LFFAVNVIFYVFAVTGLEFFWFFFVFCLGFGTVFCVFCVYHVFMIMMLYAMRIFLFSSFLHGVLSFLRFVFIADKRKRSTSSTAGMDGLCGTDWGYIYV